jgi:hypothetical protein
MIQPYPSGDGAERQCNTKRCSCKKTDSQCTELCQCENMENTELMVTDSDNGLDENSDDNEF